MANDVELVLDEAAYLAAAEAGGTGAGEMRAGGVVSTQPVQDANEVLLAARSEYETIVASARNEANAIVVKANDDAARIILRARAESRGKPSAESSAVVEAAYAQAASDPVLAREQARLMIAEARAVRERILTDLNKRRRVAHVQLEQLRVAREKLTETLREARRIVDDSARDLSTAEVEARLAADAAGRRISAEALPSIGELEVELWGGRHMPSTPTFASSSTPVSDADDSFETASPASTPTQISPPVGEVLGAPSAESPASLAVDASVEALVEVSVGASVVASVVAEHDVVGGGVVDVGVVGGGVVALNVPMLDVPMPESSLGETVSGEGSGEVVGDVSDHGVADSDRGAVAVALAETLAVDLVGAPISGLTADDAGEIVGDTRAVFGIDAVVVDLSQAESRDVAADAIAEATAENMQPVVAVLDASLVDGDPGVSETADPGVSETAEAKKRPANVDDLFARLRADRERAAVEARSVLGVKESDGGEPIAGAVLDLRPNGGDGGSGNSDGSSGSGGSGNPKRSKGSPKSGRSGGNSVAGEAQSAPQRTSGIAVLERSAQVANAAGTTVGEDADEHVTGIVLDLRPTNPLSGGSSATEPRVGSLSTFDESQDTVSEADDGMDFVVGPLHSSLIRTVKRRLHDEQSSILALLRSYRGTLDVDRLLGTEQDHQLRLTAEIRPIFVDAFRVGAQKTGATMTDSQIDDLLREHIENVAASVTATIRNEVALIVATQSGSDSRALGESLTSTYRTWTTERIGTVVTGAVFETYRLGTAA